MPAAPFVPTDQVVEAYETLICSPWFEQHETLLSELLNYFEGTWIGQLVRANRRRKPRYSVEMWNCLEFTKQGIPRTNNAIEGWHQSFSSLLPGDHPTIWKFIDGLKLEQGKNESEIEQCIAGIAPPSMRKSYKSRYQNILTVVNDFGNRDILDYLRGIAK